MPARASSVIWAITLAALTVEAAFAVVCTAKTAPNIASVSGAVGSPEYCLSQCAVQSQGGCCLYNCSYGQASCTFISGTIGGPSLPLVASANCYPDGHCDGWNWGNTCTGQPSPPTPAPPTPPPPTPGLWNLVWSDDFTDCPGGRPDPKKWKFEVGQKGVRNGEYQWYTDRNAACGDGKLVITARNEVPSDNPKYNYTSSLIKTQGIQEWTYGRFEMKGKIPINPGSWPAFWVEGDGDSWPYHGEVDIMEYYSGGNLANFICCTYEWDKWSSKKMPVDAAWASQSHVWALEWDEATMTITVDGNVLNTYPAAAGNVPGHPNPWTGATKDFIRLNLAIGGQNGGEPSGWDSLDFEVDYVKVYQKSRNTDVALFA